MEIPNLPTDNLYKFIALSGVSIVLFFISVFFIRLGRIDESIYKQNIEIGELKFEKLLLKEKDSVLVLEINQLRKEFEKYKFDPSDTIIILDDLIKNLKDPAYREYLKFIYTYRTEIIPEKKILNDLSQRLKQREENENLIRTKENSIILKNSLLDSDIKSLKRFNWFMGIGVFIGLSLASSGFRLWYNKVQKYLDSKLEKETLEEGQKNKNKT